MTYNTMVLHSAASADANGPSLDCEGYSILGVQITGTFTTAVVYFEGTVDKSTWVSLEAINVASGAKATSAAAAGVYRMGVAGLVQARARLDWTSGTSITVTARLSDAADPMLQDVVLSAGAASIGILGANSGVDIGDVTLTTGSARVGSVDATVQIADTDVSTTNPVPTSGFLDVIEVILSLNTSQYASGDLLADTQEVANFFANGHPAVLYSLQVIDEDDQAGAIDFLFLRSNQSMGTENSAFAPADAAALEILTEVPVLATDYNDYTNSQQAIKQVSDTGMGVILKPTSGTSLYIAAISRDTKTYTAAGVRVRVGLVQAG